VISSVVQMKVTLNGMQRDLPDQITLAALLELEDEPTGHVVVEVNGSFIPAAEHAAVHLTEGDRIEVILPAFGG